MENWLRGNAESPQFMFKSQNIPKKSALVGGVIGPAHLQWGSVGLTS